MNTPEERIKKVKTEQEKRFLKGRITAILDRVYELDVNEPIAKHLWTILRTKGEEKSPHYWTDDLLFDKVDKYYKEYRKILEDRFDGLDSDIDEDFLNSRMEKNPTVYGRK